MSSEHTNPLQSLAIADSEHDGNATDRLSTARLSTTAKHRELLQSGGRGNADVIVVTENGSKWLIKDFSSRGIVVRRMLAPFLISRMLRIAKRLEDMQGVPKGIHRRNRSACAYQYVEGTTLRVANKNKMQISASFFPALESLVRELHSRGIVHLDIRNARNIIVTPEQEPVLIDFCSALSIRRMPNFLRRLLCNVDLSGVYKHWRKISPHTFDDERAKLLIGIERLKSIWIFNRHPFKKMKQRGCRMLSERRKR